MSYLQVSYFSPSIWRQTTFHMCLPNDVPPEMREGNKCYDRPMKTLMLLHGYSGNTRDWTLGSLISDISLKYNLAVIMPSGDNSFYLNAKGCCFKYADFVGFELMDYARKTFGLSKDAKDTFIGGLSMGGFGAIHAGLEHPEVYGKIFGLSSALIVNGLKDIKPGVNDGIADYDYYCHVFGDLDKVKETDKDPEFIVKERLKKGDKIQPIYMACGSEDFLIENNREFKKFLESEGVKVDYHESEGIHDWIFWNKYLEPAIEWALEE
ncbi:MAG: acetylesterase [Lachnospiraceae bacterium]|nr:acetylesterase [Lachnospiraceae bacterium]